MLGEEDACRALSRFAGLEPVEEKPATKEDRSRRGVLAAAIDSTATYDRATGGGKNGKEAEGASESSGTTRNPSFLSKRTRTGCDSCLRYWPCSNERQYIE